MSAPELVAYVHMILFSLAVVELIRCGQDSWRKRSAVLLVLFILSLSWYISCEVLVSTWARTDNETEHVYAACGVSAYLSLGFGAACHFGACIWFYLVKRQRTRAAISLVIAVVLLFLLDSAMGLRTG